MGDIAKPQKHVADIETLFHDLPEPQGPGIILVH